LSGLRRNHLGNDFLTWALYYAGLGYKVFPCVPNDKRPLTPNGLLDATTDELQIELWAADNPDANLAICTDGLLVVDRDTDKESGQPNPWLADDPRLTELFAGAVAQTPRGGDHAWFRQPAGKNYRNTVDKLAPQVDTRGNGGYVLVYPSIVNGKQYTWLQTYELEVGPDKLPTPPDWLLDMLDDRKPVVKQERSTESEVSEGGRNAYLTRTGGSLRRMGLDEDEILAALMARNASKCNPPLEESEVRKIAWSVSRYEEDQIATLIVEGCEPEKPSEDPGKFPSRLLNVPGFIHQVMDLNLRGAIRPQPEIALAGAVSLLSTVTGRKVCGETRLRTNNYIIAICDTGGGKDRSLKLNKDLLLAAGLEKYIPMEDLASAAALVNSMTVQPSILLQIDEIGKFLRTTKDEKANPHLAEVATVLMKFFSCANSFYSGKGYAAIDKKKSIVNPHLCLFGVSVPQSVMESISVENMTDGLMSRLLIIEASDHNPSAVRYPVFSDPCEELIEELKYWDQYNPGSGNLSGLNTPQPRVLYDGPGVNDMFYEAEEWYRSQREAGEPGAALWTRAAEKARKLALVYQLSADRESTELSQEATRWALDVVLYLTKRMIFLSRDWVSDSRLGADKNKIVRRLREKGEQTVSRLLRFMQHLKSTELTALLGDMIASGIISSEMKKVRGKDVPVYKN